MNINHEQHNEKSLLLHLNFNQEDYQDKVSEQLKQLRKSASVPGFRPGKTPVAIIEKKYGKSVRYDILTRKLNDETFKYLQEQKIKSIGGFIITKDENQYDPAQEEYSYEMTVATMPDLGNPFDEKISLPFYSIQPSEENVSEMITNAQRNYGDRKEVDDIQEDDMLYVAAREVDDKGVAIEGGLDVAETYMMVKYIRNEETKSALLKAKKGDTLTIDIQKTFDSNASEIASFFQIEKDKAEKLSNPVEITINKVMRVEPHDVDEKLFKLMLGQETTVSTEEELRAELLKQQTQYHEELSNSIFTSEVSNFIMDQIKDIPVSAEHLAILLQDKEELSDEDRLQQAKRYLPYLRYRFYLGELLDTLQVEISQEDIKKQLGDLIVRQLHQMGLGQLVSTPGFVERLVQQRMEERSPEVNEAEITAQETVLARKVRELVSLKQEEIPFERVAEIQEALSKSISDRLGANDDVEAAKEA